jgi:hypothetical protein
MTAQVGILNSEVAVLASDTASSSRYGENIKIFKSIKKIYKLADHLPVAIMIHGSARLTGILWSRVVDLFRKQLGGEEKNRLKDYFEEFINFIENNSELTNYEHSLAFFINWTWENYNDLEQMVYQSGELDETKFKSWISSRNESLRNIKESIINDSKYDIIEKSFNSYLVNIAGINYIRHPYLIKKFQGEIANYLTLLFIKTLTDTFKSGVVVAGFGKDDIYPSLINAEIEGLFENKLRMTKPKHYLVGENYTDETKSRARIIPFAQSDGATLFMEGVAPKIKEFILDTSKDNTNEVFSFLQNHYLFNELSKEKRLKILNDIKLYSDRQFQEFNNNIRHYTNSNYTDPIISSVSSMGSLDLAELARTLVNLTSIKRRYAMDQEENVGGETDTVILSKAGGYIEVNNKTD